MMKKCCKCKIDKELQEFHKQKSRRDGLQTQCKQCNSLYKNSEVYNMWHKDYKDSGRKQMADKEYAKTLSGKLSHSKANKTYSKTLKGRIRNQSKDAKYKAAKLHAIPKWLTKNDWCLIDMKYALAIYLTDTTGIQWEVDHIIPLQGKNVSGLHVPWNLRVIPARENEAKGNRIL